jgi:hypothetical protein
MYVGTGILFSLINGPFKPYKGKINEKWKLIAFLINNFFPKRLKNKRSRPFIRENTIYVKNR